MQHPRVRRTAPLPTILDAIVLVAAMAIALAMARGWPSPRWCAMPAFAVYNGRPPSTARSLHYFFATRISWTIPFAITFTAALLILRFRSPRPRFIRIARQPGAVACAAALVAMAARMGQEALGYALAYLTRPSSAVRLPSPPFLRYDNAGWHLPLGQVLHNIVLETFPLLVSPSVGIAVVVAWGVQWASGRWRPEPSWLDRAGRLAGAYWIAQAVTIVALTELWKFLM
ncbi:MAG: hypothetical protein ACHRXM_23455 [Isosphaerales bacterium]